MPSTTLKTIPLTEWYCQECTIGQGHEPGLIKEEHTCSVCGETKLCTHAMKIEKSYNSRTRIGEAGVPEIPTHDYECPGCHAELESVNYTINGLYEYGTYNLDSCDYDSEGTDGGDESIYTCPNCEYETSNASAFEVPVLAENSTSAIVTTKGGDSI